MTEQTPPAEPITYASAGVDVEVRTGPWWEPVEGRRLGQETKHRDPHEVEAAMLLDPDARLGYDGVYHAGE